MIIICNSPLAFEQIHSFIHVVRIVGVLWTAITRNHHENTRKKDRNKHIYTTKACHIDLAQTSWCWSTEIPNQLPQKKKEKRCLRDLKSAEQ